MHDSIKILIVSYKKRAIYENILSYMKQYDYIVKEKYDDYSSIIDYAKKFIPDIIITDVAVEDGDGISLVCECRRFEELSATKYVFLSAALSQSIINMTYEAGADYYFMMNHFLYTYR